MKSPYTDINPNHKVFKLFPQSLHDYLLLGRYDRPVGTLLVMFPCWWGVLFANPSWSNILLECLIYMMGALFLRAAGCIVNDLWDIRIDQKVERTQNRPLASGRISKNQALVFFGLHMCVGGLIFLWLSPLAKIMCGISIFLFIAYPLMKRFFPIPQLWLGITFNIGLLIAWTNHYDLIPFEIWLLYLGSVFWTIGYDTIYAFQDLQDDLKIGVKSSAILFQKMPKLAVSFCYIAMIICFMFALYEMHFSYFAMAVMIAVFYHLYWQIKNWQVKDKASCLSMFKSNVIFGAFVFLALLLNLSIETIWLHIYGV